MKNKLKNFWLLLKIIFKYDNLTIALDASGSMQSYCKEFLKYLNYLNYFLFNKKIRLIGFSTEIEVARNLSKEFIKYFQETISSYGGGTKFEPVLNDCISNNCSNLVLFSDGYNFDSELKNLSLNIILLNPYDLNSMEYRHNFYNKIYNFPINN